MSAIRDALRIYGPEFQSLHGLYLEHGYCYSEPGLLLLARPCREECHELWVDKEDADAWWVELVVGAHALASLARIAPFPLPRVGWMRGLRGQGARFYDLNRLFSTLRKL